VRLLSGGRISIIFDFCLRAIQTAMIVHHGCLNSLEQNVRGQSGNVVALPTRLFLVRNSQEIDTGALGRPYCGLIEVIAQNGSVRGAKC
jgi:hypothetical protein